MKQRRKEFQRGTMMKLRQKRYWDDAHDGGTSRDTVWCFWYDEGTLKVTASCCVVWFHRDARGELAHYPFKAVSDRAKKPEKPGINGKTEKLSGK